MELLDKDGLTEEEYLAAYRPGDWPKPSVTADMAVFREDEAQRSALLLQLPPRITRYDPEEEPFGSVPYANVPDQSRHRSYTLPLMS